MYSVQYLAKQGNAMLFADYSGKKPVPVRISYESTGSSVILKESGRKDVKCSTGLRDALMKRFEMVNMDAWTLEPTPCFPNECFGFTSSAFSVGIRYKFLVAECLFRGSREGRYVKVPTGFSVSGLSPVWYGYFREGGYWWLVINSGFVNIEILEFHADFVISKTLNGKLPYCTLRELMFG